MDGPAKTIGAAGTKVSGLFSYEKGQGSLQNKQLELGLNWVSVKLVTVGATFSGMCILTGFFLTWFPMSFPICLS